MICGNKILVCMPLCRSWTSFNISSLLILTTPNLSTAHSNQGFVVTTLLIMAFVKVVSDLHLAKSSGERRVLIYWLLDPTQSTFWIHFLHFVLGHRFSYFPNLVSSPIRYLFFFFLFGGCTHSMWKLLGQGSNLHHCSDSSHSSDNARSFTCWATREL